MDIFRLQEIIHLFQANAFIWLQLTLVTQKQHMIQSLSPHDVVPQISI